MTDEQTGPPASQGSERIVLEGLNDVEIVTNALAVYIDHMVETHGNDAPRPRTSEWLDSKDPNCIHLHTTEVPRESFVTYLGKDESLWPDTLLICANCSARQHTVDVNDAIRGTLQDAIELRQRIVKEWGYDPTYES